MLNIGIFAQTAPAGGAGPAGGSMFSILAMVAVFVIFYIILILPESRRRKKLQKEISEIKQGDKIITTGGIRGVVDYVGERTVYIKSLDSKFELSKEAIAGIDRTGMEKSK